MRATVSQDRVRLDVFVRQLYGTERGGNVEAVLSANPGLAALAATHSGFLPRGTTVDIPTIGPAPSNPALTRPWS